MIEVENFSKIKVCERRLIFIAEAFLKKEKKEDYHLSVSLLKFREMSKINFLYRGKKGTTDVLSFSSPALIKDKFYGEILLDPEFIKKEAKKNRVSFREELDFVFVHGLLHLSGLNDEKEKERQKMISRGKDFLSSL